jgi:hypothetical protein
MQLGYGGSLMFSMQLTVCSSKHKPIVHHHVNPSTNFILLQMGFPLKILSLMSSCFPHLPQNGG